MGSKGRRADVNTNAFWAAAAALLPRDLLVNRKGRAVMRVLDLNYRAIKRAGEIRARTKDKHGGWQLLTTNEHCARVDWNQV
jgi:predicted nucleic acid-binding protein